MFYSTKMRLNTIFFVDFFPSRTETNVRISIWSSVITKTGILTFYKMHFFVITFFDFTKVLFLRRKAEKIF